MAAPIVTRPSDILAWSDAIGMMETHEERATYLQANVPQEFHEYVYAMSQYRLVEMVAKLPTKERRRAALDSIQHDTARWYVKLQVERVFRLRAKGVDLFNLPPK